MKELCKSANIRRSRVQKFSGTFSRTRCKKVAHTRLGLPSVVFRSWSRFLAVSLQVTWVINPTVGCHYFPPGLQLPLQPLRGLLPILLLGGQRHNGCEQFAYKTVTRQRRGCNLNPGPTALESSTLTTRLPSHLTVYQWLKRALWLNRQQSGFLCVYGRCNIRHKSMDVYRACSYSALPVEN